MCKTGQGSSPVVSVVLPTHNRAGLLPRTLESILRQTYQDFELLIVDDGSSDNTDEVVEALRSADPRIRYLRLEQNSGIGFARSFGNTHATGKYIALADSDDLWLPEKLNLQIETMESWPEIDMLFSDWLNIDHRFQAENQGFLETQKGFRQLVVRRLARNVHAVKGGLEKGILRANFVQPATMVLRAKTLVTVGDFNRNLRSAADLEFVWRSSLMGAQYAYLDCVLLERHKYQSSVSANPMRSNYAVVQALECCYQTCLRSQSPDLGGSIRTAQRRAWMNLIGSCAKRNQHADATRAYFRSLKQGFSFPVFIFFLFSLGGPNSIPFALKLRLHAMRFLHVAGKVSD